MPTNWDLYERSKDKKYLAAIARKREAAQYDSEYEALGAQIGRQGEELSLRGIEPPKAGNPVMGAIGRTFDVISRPLYTSANVVGSLLRDAANDEGTADTFRNLGREAWEGFSGKDKTTYSEVLEERGVENKWVKGIGGFALDVALDPTTYISLGTSVPAKAAASGAVKVGRRSAAKGMERRLAARTAEGQAARAVLKGGESSVGKRVNQRLLDDFMAKGLTGTSEHLSGTGAKRLSRRMLEDEAIAAGQRAGDDFLRATQPKFGVRYMGKTLPGLQSAKLYNFGEKASMAFKATSAGKGLSQTFQTSHLFPGLNKYKREAEGYGVAKFEEVDRTIADIFKGVSKEDKITISNAIESNTKLTGELGRLQDEAIQLNESVTRMEIDSGLLNPADMLDNYLYHHYQTTDRLAVAEFKAARKKVQNPNKTKKSYTTIKSLDQAKAEGLKPVDQIDEILKLRYAKSYKEQARATFSTMVNNEFGVKLGKGVLAEKTAKGLGLVEARSKYLKGLDTYLPKEVNDAIRHMDGLYDSLDETNQLLRFFDKSLAHWKFGATAINPGHHTRNAVGDLFLNSLDGVVNPRRYAQSARVLKGDDFFVQVGKSRVPASKIRELYQTKGVKSGYTRVEIGARKLGITEKIREGAELREDWTRMAHFIDALKKEGSHIGRKDVIGLDAAASQAGVRVRKWNIDYGDLTDIEKKVFKRVAPFYTWMRKNIPLQLESLALTPGRQNKVPKALTAINNLLGNDPDGEYPQQGLLDTVPSWIRDMSGIRIMGEGQGRHGLYLDPSAIPSFDAIRMLGDPIQKLAEGDVEGAGGALSSSTLNMLNPAMKAVVELGTDQNTFTGAERDTGLTYVANQLPITRLLAGQLDPNVDSGDKQLRGINWLTGTSLRGIGDKQIEGEFRRQQDLYEGKLKSSGDRAADMLAGRPFEAYEGETPFETNKRRETHLQELRDSGLSLALLADRNKSLERIREERLQKILNSYIEGNWGVG